MDGKDSLIPQEPISVGAEEFDALDRIAAGLYSMASMLVGEGEDSIILVETAIANTEIPGDGDAEEARRSSRTALCTAAIDLIAARDPESLAAPEGLVHAATCIEDDDLDAAGISRAELEAMLAGPNRASVKNWIESLRTPMRVIFVLRAVAGFTADETAAMLSRHGGSGAAGWNADAVREIFRQGMCSLASQVIHATTAR